MKKTVSFLLIFLLIFTVFLPIAQGAESEFKIDIFHTSNIGGIVEESTNSVGFAKFKTFIKNSTANGKIVLDAGNLFSGNSFATKSRGDSVAEVISYIPFNAINAANNDFCYGADKLIDLSKDYSIDIVSSNIKVDNEKVFKPYKIESINGIKIGIFGVTSNIIKSAVNEIFQQNVETGDKKSILTEAKKTVDELKSNGVNFIVALSQLEGKVSAEELAKKVPGINLIIDGNSKDISKTGNKVNSVLITKTGKDFEAFGVCSIKFNKNKELISFTENTYNANDLKDVKQDKDVSDIIAMIKKENEFIDKTVLATLNYDYTNNEPKANTKTGKLIALCMKNELGTQGAIINSGAIKGYIAKGEINRVTFEKILPNSETLVNATVSGKWLINYFNKALNLADETYPQFDGFKLYYKNIKNKIKVTKITIDGKKVKLRKNYSIATTETILKGNNKYKSYSQSETVREVCIRQLSMNPDLLNKANEQNIVFVKDLSNNSVVIFIIAISTLLVSAVLCIFIFKRKRKALKSPQ